MDFFDKEGNLIFGFNVPSGGSHKTLNTNWADELAKSAYLVLIGDSTLFDHPITYLQLEFAREKKMPIYLLLEKGTEVPKDYVRSTDSVVTFWWTKKSDLPNLNQQVDLHFDTTHGDAYDEANPVTDDGGELDEDYEDDWEDQLNEYLNDGVDTSAFTHNPGHGLFLELEDMDHSERSTEAIAELLMMIHAAALKFGFRLDAWGDGTEEDPDFDSELE